jgi:hypothetical protein
MLEAEGATNITLNVIVDAMTAWPNCPDWLGIGMFGSRAARRTRFSGG